MERPLHIQTLRLVGLLLGGSILVVGVLSGAAVLVTTHAFPTPETKSTGATIVDPPDPAAATPAAMPGGRTPPPTLNGERRALTPHRAPPQPI